MLLRLAWATLTRHRSRTLLAVLGVAVSAAMLLDMVMLSSGMRASFKNLLLSRGFQLRARAQGHAAVRHRRDDSRRERRDRACCATIPGVTTVSPVLGGQLHIARGRADASPRPRSASIPPCRAIMRSLKGARRPRRTSWWRATTFCAASGARLGDTLSAAAGYDPQLRAFTRPARAGGRRPRALSLHAGRSSASSRMPLATLQAMQGSRARDRVSLFMVKARDGATVRQRAAPHRDRAAARIGDLHRDGDAPGGRAAELLPAARAHPRRREPRRGVSARHDARDGVGERAARRDRRDARDRRGAVARRAADRARGRGDHGRRRARPGSGSVS